MYEVVNDYVNAARTIAYRKPEAAPSKLGEDLKAIVAAEGVAIYRNVSGLSAQLQSRGTELCLIKQVELAVCGSGFVNYLDRLGTGLSAIDINNIILSMEDAGLAPNTARELTEDLLFSLNVPLIAPEVPVKEGAATHNYVERYIPHSLYRVELNSFAEIVKGGKKLTEEQMRQLYSYLAARIPQAYTIMGMVCDQGLSVPRDVKKAMEHWQYAAAHGDPEAYGLLGDCYYNVDNKKAYELYSRPGAMALSEKRWSRFRNLLKVKKFNFSQLLGLGAMFVLATVFMFIFQNSAITGTHAGAAVIFTIINALSVGAAAFVHIRNPYQDLRNFTLPMILMLLIFVLILV